MIIFLYRFWTEIYYSLLIAVMTCMENGIPMKEVDMDAIWKGYDLAYPGRRVIEEVEETPVFEDVFGWDEYWGW